MKNNIQGFTLIELLIVIAIIGILAAVLIPNIMAAQKKGYDAGAISCGKSLQTAEAMSYANDSKYVPITADMSNANVVCSNPDITVQSISQSDSDYALTVTNSKGSRIYTFTPSNMTSVPRP